MLRIIFAALTLLVSIPVGAADRAANPQVELKTTLGAIVVELNADKAPLTVENFLQYVKNGHYDGTVFHRVIPGFMIQSGGFTADFKEKPTRAPIRNEAGNGLRNAVGTLAMARTSDPHSASAQFFINVADNTSLNFRFPTQEGYGYAVFGKVVKGMDVVERIVKVQTGPGPASHQNVPVKPVIIEQARLIMPPDKQDKAKQ
jgi:peptidyl-prolyl cis-trans isomerase A (cyclophilin A)/peptidyl-prolyl cis-trans isomerase B (cyclophilin B)